MADKVSKRDRKGRSDRKWRTRRSGGCGYLFFVAISAGTLLLINAAFVFSIFQWYVPADSFFQQDIRFAQVVQLIGPVVMILAEYWIYDLIVDRLAILEDATDSADA